MRINEPLAGRRTQGGMEDKPMNTATKEFDTKVSRAIDRAVDDIRTTFDRSTRDALVKRINVKLTKRGQKLKISRKAFDATLGDAHIIDIQGNRGRSSQPKQEGL